MASLNKVMLIGNLGRDPELRYTANGMAVATFSLATKERSKNEDRTEWHRIVTWDKLAEICGKYLSKGKQVYIEGRLQTREWQDKDGNKRSTTEIVANVMQMLGSKDPSAGAQAYGPGGASQGAGPQSSSRAASSDRQEPPEPFPEAPPEEDDIPF